MITLYTEDMSYAVHESYDIDSVWENLIRTKPETNWFRFTALNGDDIVIKFASITGLRSHASS